MKIRKSKYHQKSVKVAHCGALIWRKFPTNCDAHLAERFLKGRENNHLLKSLFKLSVIFMAFTASGCTLAVPEAGTDGNGDRLIGARGGRLGLRELGRRIGARDRGAGEDERTGERRNGGGAQRLAATNGHGLVSFWSQGAVPDKAGREGTGRI